MKMQCTDSCQAAFIAKDNPLKEAAIADQIYQALVIATRCPKCQEKVTCSGFKEPDPIREEMRFTNVHLCLSPTCDWFQEQILHLSLANAKKLIVCPFCDRKLS